MTASTYRRLSVLAWVASIVLIVLAGVLLLVGGGSSVDPGDVDLGVQREIRGRTIGLGVVGLVAILGAVSFAVGSWSRNQAEAIERRETSSGFGIRPPRSRPGGNPADGSIMPPSSGSHDDLPPADPDADPDADPEKP